MKINGLFVMSLIEYHLQNMFFLFLMYASLRMGIFYWKVGYKHNAFIFLLYLTIASKAIMQRLRAYELLNAHWLFYFPLPLFIFLIVNQQRRFVKKDKSFEERKIINKKLVFVTFELLIVFVLMMWWAKRIGRDFF